MELFDFLATRVAEIDTDKQVISTYHKDVFGLRSEILMVLPLVSMRRLTLEFCSMFKTL